MTVRHSTRHGGALISVLAFAAISSLIVACVGVLVLSHLSRGRTEANYAKAISVAEAGVSHELEWIAGDPDNPNRAHQYHPTSGQPGVATIVVPGGGTAVVGVRSEAGGNWSVGSALKVVSTGTVNGVSRTVEVLAKPDSAMAPTHPEDQYTVFGLRSVTLSGANSRIVGSAGTNGSFSATGGSNAVSGKLTFGGVNPSVSGSRVYRQATAMPYPSVSDLARHFHATGMAGWKTQNNNDRIRMFNPGNARYLLSEAASAGFSKSNWPLVNGSFSGVTTDLHTGDRAGGGRYSNSAEGIYGDKVLIFPPGDYYFEEVRLTTGQGSVLVDNASGPVRIWIGGNNGSDDTIHMTTLLTNPNDPGTFRVLYGKPQELSVTGTTYVSGVYYAVDDAGRSSIKLAGNSFVSGMLIANDVRIVGNSVVSYPSNPLVSQPRDPARGYRVANQWRELDSQGRPRY